jgi:hypothetical protein
MKIPRKVSPFPLFPFSPFPLFPFSPFPFSNKPVVLSCYQNFRNLLKMESYPSGKEIHSGKEYKEKRHQIFESKPSDRQRAYLKLDVLTPTVRDFLRNKEPFASDGVELRTAKVVDGNRTLQYVLIGGTECDQRHYNAVRAYLPGFTIRTIFEPQAHGGLSAFGSIMSGQMVLEFSLTRKSFLSGGIGGFGVFGVFGGKKSTIVVNVLLIVLVGVLIVLSSYFINHTNNDSDRFGVLRRLGLFYDQ